MTEKACVMTNHCEHSDCCYCAEFARIVAEARSYGCEVKQ